MSVREFFFRRFSGTLGPRFFPVLLLSSSSFFFPLSSLGVGLGCSSLLLPLLPPGLPSSKAGPAQHMPCLFFLFLSFLSARPAPLSLVLSFSFFLSFLSFFFVFSLSLSLPLACAQTQSSPTGFALGVAPRIALVVLLQSWDAIPRMAFRLPGMYVMHAVPGMEFSGSCSENCGGRFAQVVGCHPVTGSSYSGDGILYVL